MSTPEDKAEDLNDPEVRARYEAFVRKRGYPRDTYRAQDGCANCRHVFERREYEGNDELYCTYNAPPRPPCMSVFMKEHGEWAQNEPCRVDHDAHEVWNQWKSERDVLPQGICIFFEASLPSAERS